MHIMMGAAIPPGAAAKDDRRHYVRVTSKKHKGMSCARLTSDQGASILLAMVRADGLAIIPEDVDHLPAMSPVKVVMLTWPER